MDKSRVVELIKKPHKICKVGQRWLIGVYGDEDELFSEFIGIPLPVD